MTEKGRRARRHFEDLEQEARAAHLGMWIFLASELLLFAALFALYASYRAHYPVAFGFGVAHGARVLGTLNTALLICSSYAAASAVHAIRGGLPKRAAGLLAFTITCGLASSRSRGWSTPSTFAKGSSPAATAPSSPSTP